jgi:putative ABC transport system substrate-binding protein
MLPGNPYHGTQRSESAAHRGVSRRAFICKIGTLSTSLTGLAMVGGCQLTGWSTATPPKLRRIGYLDAAKRSAFQTSTNAFADQLHQLGWRDGENLAIEWRFAEGHAELVSQLPADLVQLPVEVLVAAGAAAALPAYQQTTSIPIILAGVGDPTVSDLVKNLARPVGNVTGTAIGSGTLSIKSVELLRTILPQLSRLGVIGDPTVPAYESITLPTAQAAQTQGLLTQVLDVSKVEDVDAAFETARAWNAHALVIAGGAPYFGAISARIGELAVEHHLPTMFQDLEAVTESGGLMAFSPDRPTEWRQAADYVDKILRGARPSDLPVQEPRQWDFLVNVKAARDLGIAFPPDAAAQVTRWVQ